MDIENIQNAIFAERVYITDHAKDEADNDHLNSTQIFESVRSGEIIEDYPLDRPYPSCLIYGRTKMNLPVHSVWAYNSETSYAVLITVYIPDPNRWVDFKKRVKR
jgi:hypothetical protein